MVGPKAIVKAEVFTWRRVNSAGDLFYIFNAPLLQRALKKECERSELLDRPATASIVRPRVRGRTSSQSYSASCLAM
jgi:hypothetical protein